MKINKINIKNFGKFKDFQLSFEDGFNLVYGENERGKSTIMAFIRLMLYGTVNRTSDLSKNIRKKYTPWDGSKMSGSIEFSHDGQNYRLEKSFAASSTSDKVTLWNLTTNTEEQTGQNDIGNRFLGIGEDAFVRSAFIGQAGSVITPENNCAGEIILKLQNLVSSGDESNSYNDIESRIKAASEKIKSRGGRIGILDRLMQNSLEYENAKMAALDAESQKSRMLAHYQEINANKEKAVSELDAKISKLSAFEDMKAYSDLEKIVGKIQNLDQIRSEADKLNAFILNGDFTVDMNFLKDVQKQLADLMSARSLIQSKTGDVMAKAAALDGFADINPDNLTKEKFDKIMELNGVILKDTENENALKLSLQSEEFALRNAKIYDESYAQNAIKINEHRDQIAETNAEIDKIIKLPATETNVKKSIKISFLPWTVLAVLSVIAGIFVNPLFYIGTAAAILTPFLISYIKTAEARKRNTEINNTDAAKNETRLNDLYRSISFTERQLNELIKAQELLVNGSRDHRSATEIAVNCTTIENSIKEIQAKIKNDRQTIQDELIKYHAGSIENLQTKYYEIQSAIARKDELTKEIDSMRNSLSSMTDEFDNNRERFFGFFARIKNVDSLELAADSLEIITGQYHDAAQMNTIVKEKEKDLFLSLNNRTQEEIMEEYLEKKKRYGNEGKYGNDVLMDCQNINDEIKLLEKEIDELKNEINLLDIDITTIKSDMSHMFLDKPELAVVEENIRNNKEQIDAYQRHYDALAIAKEQMDKAFQEMQKNFGPQVNNKAASIFSSITDGKYNELMISRSLNISFRDPENNNTVDWQYLSSGAIDQAYFSLRLAVCELMSEQANELPLFIDDAFLQYDDSRTKRALSFLADYAAVRKTQIIFFTCHKNVMELVSGQKTSNVLALK